MFRHWLITDTHFGHQAMIGFCGRPPDFTERIKHAWQRDVGPDDVVIHLGDVGDQGPIQQLPGRKILVKGNHDKQSYTWYLQRGFQFVCETLTIQAYGHRLLFSHIPQPFRNDWDLNIHGHFHNTDFRRHEPQIAAILTPQHLLMALEHDGYAPMLLRSFLHKNKQA